MSKLIIDVHQKPNSKRLWLLLSLQHVFAMFGATVLVPILTGLDISVGLLASGIGTLTYILFTKAKVPVYLGSSFAYISVIILAKETGGQGAVSAGLLGVGIVYAILATIIKFTGVDWLKKLMPPIVVGPMIMVIGLSLASVAINQTGMSAGAFDLKSAIVALTTILVTGLFAIKAKGFLKIVPILMGIISGYALSMALGMVDFTALNEAAWFAIPNVQIPGVTYDMQWSALIMMIPIAFVTIAEHIGDHTVLGTICNKDFLKNPGLNKTLMGDGIATLISGLIGGPANTTYGENTGVVGMTKVGSVYVTGLAAVLAITISMIGKVAGFIQTIPLPVMGGISVILFGVIAFNGVRILINDRTDFSNPRNLIIASSMIILGLGGAAINIGEMAQFSGMSLAAMVGIALNAILPYDLHYENKNNEELAIEN